MVYTRATTAVLIATLVLSTLFAVTTAKPALAGPDDPDTPTATWQLNQYAPRPTDNVILKWDEELLQAIRADAPGTGPTVSARALGVLHTATYDAWATYDAVANGVHYRPARQPTAQRTLENKSKAISFAAYRTLAWLFPSQVTGGAGPTGTKADFNAQMAELGYDLNDQSPAAQVGNQAAQATINFRSTDNSNQTYNPTTNGNTYPDTTGYQPVNDWNRVTDRWRWQPLCVPDPGPNATTCGGTVQRAATPHWQYVKPFALTSASQYTVAGPRKLPDRSGYDPRDITNLYTATINLTDVQKVRAEYWADGPRSEFPPGHWALFAGAMSRRRGHSLDADAQMFFMLGNALFDSSIASWHQKYKYDFVRPQTAIREHYKGQDIWTWTGPYGKWELRPAAEWKPYQAPNVVTPPFPEYVSGHSTFSGASAYVLRMFTGSDVLNASVTVRAGTSLFEPRTATQPGTPANDVTLNWATLTAAAADAGQSRRDGGIHFEFGDLNGRALGQSVGAGARAKARAYIEGRI